MYEPSDAALPDGEHPQGRLKAIPGQREDIFADKTIDLRAKRSLMSFLKVVADPSALEEALTASGSQSLQRYLVESFRFSDSLVSTMHALTLSPHYPDQTPVTYALPRLARHLGSMGAFGPGFGAVIPKWGGLSEIVQVSCRACAVGGGVYMLSHSIENSHMEESGDAHKLEVNLSGQSPIRTTHVAKLSASAPRSESASLPEAEYVTRGIAVVSSPLQELFPRIAEGSPPSACTIVVFPADSLRHEGQPLARPLYLMIHSSDTGECPEDQCKFLYACPSK